LKIFNEVSTIFAVCGGFLLQFLGGYDLLLQSILVLVVLDWITGLMKSIDRGELSPNRGLRGIAKKVSMFTLLALSVALENIMDGAIPIREVTLMFLIGNEGISILENIVHFIEVPDKMKDMLLSIRGGDNSGN